MGNIRTVRGRTAMMIAGSAPVQEHGHAYAFDVAQGSDSAQPITNGRTVNTTWITGQRPGPQTPHTHTISQAGRTNQAEDGHYHVLPIQDDRTATFNAGSTVDQTVTAHQEESLLRAMKGADRSLAEALLNGLVNEGLGLPGNDFPMGMVPMSGARGTINPLTNPDGQGITPPAGQAPAVPGPDGRARGVRRKGGRGRASGQEPPNPTGQ